MSKFANAVHETPRIQEACEFLGDKVDKIFALLLQRVFSGQLTAKWGQARIRSCWSKCRSKPAC